MLDLRQGALARIYVSHVAPYRPSDSRYETENGDAMEREVQEFLYGLVRAVKPQLVVETGTHTGSTAEVIGNALEDNGLGHLTSIECDADLADVARERCAHLPSVTIHTGDSLAYTPDEPVDLLIVDGSTDRLGERRAFEPYLSERAIVVQHDFGDSMWPAYEGWNALTLPTPRGLLIASRW